MRKSFGGKCDMYDRHRKGTTGKNRTEGVNGTVEFIVGSLTVLSPAYELPFDLQSDLNLDTQFDYRPITLRRPNDRAMFRVQARILTAFREYLTGRGFTEFQAPAIVGGDAEGGAEVFSVDYFGTPASLATSPATVQADTRRRF